MKIQIFQIKVNDGRREISPEAVHELADSISNVGLMNPITVDQDYTLIAGLHRLEAAKLLGWAEIECTVSNLEGLMAELAEIDENVVRAGLSPIDYSDLLLRRKEIYETLHPETKATREGGPYRGNQHQEVNRKMRQTSKSFAQDTAEKLGVNKCTIERQVQIAKNLTPEAKGIIRDTGAKITKQDALKLSRLDPEQQKEAAIQFAAGIIRSVDEYHPNLAEIEPVEEHTSKPAEGSAAPASRTDGYPTIRDLAADLKNPDKDRSSTPDTFVKSFSLSLHKFCQNVASFEDSGFASVFPALKQTHLDQIQQEIDSVYTVLDDFLTKLKGKADKC